MTFLEDRDFKDVPSIPEYYRGKTVFITGGTGFMGKVLIEKLLYSCTDLDRIYLLLRSKKGVKPADRLSAIYRLPCFDRLRNEKPGVFESKVFFIAGDCGELGLGMSEEDRALIVNRTNIIYHVAASVRFDDPLKAVVKLNVLSTREIIELAKHVRHLESFVHVSTLYSNTNHNPVDEVVYPPLANWRETIEICEKIDDQIVKVLTPKYLNETPNTYVFTKQLAEHVVYEQKGKLPVVICRPSIVMSSCKEPMPGWVDNFNGLVGILVAGAKGIVRILHCDPIAIKEIIPVDLAIKAFIVASWIRGTKKFESTDDVPVYNCCSGPLTRIDSKQIFTIGNENVVTVPLDNMIWNVGGSMSKNNYVYFTQVLIFHILPAMLIDILLWIFGLKPILINLARKIYTGNLAYELFLTKEWIFYNKNFVTLRSKIKKEDEIQFYYGIETMDLQEYFKNFLLGARRYLLKEKDEDLPKARAHYRRMAFLDKLVKDAFYGCIFWWVVKIIFV